jgi:hypothetical protein
MVRFADGIGPGAFDEEQAKAYAADIDIETEFPHDQVFLDILWQHSRGAAFDLGVGLVDTPHGFLKCDLQRQYMLSIIVPQ